MKKLKLRIESIVQYESAVELMYFLDTFGFKEAWKARGAIMRREGEYWDRCGHCDEPMGLHDEPCYDEDGPRRRYNEDDIDR